MATLLPSRMRLWLWGALGFKVGKNCWISPLSIVVTDKLEIGNNVQIFPLAVIFNLGLFRLGNGSIISYLGLIYSSNPVGEFCAGERFAMGMLAMIDCTSGVNVGDFVAIGPRSIIYTHANAFPTSHGYSNRFEPVRIGNRVWLMLDVKVMPGVSIANDVHVAPSAVVFRSIKKSGFFLNSYQVEKDVLTPIPASQKVNCNQYFYEQWFQCLLNDLQKYAADYFHVSIEPIYKDGNWHIPNQNVSITVTKSIDESSDNQGDNSLSMKVTFISDNTAKPILAWIDPVSLSYSKSAEQLPDWPILHSYFFARRGMALAESDE